MLDMKQDGFMVSGWLKSNFAHQKPQPLVPSVNNQYWMGDSRKQKLKQLSNQEEVLT